MKRLDEAPGGHSAGKNIYGEGENQSETSRNKSLLLPDRWKPCQRTRATFKECFLKLSCCLGSVCGLEWYSYAALGVLMATSSFLMDLSVTKLLKTHQWLYMKLDGHSLLQFCCWTLYPACLCAVAAFFSHNICPFSAGSGIPEVRVMLSGVTMPQYLSLTNMFTKFLGLICTLSAGSTVFLGKVGPFVHLSTMLGAYLSNLCFLTQANKKEKSAREMMVVASAVGVASCFGAPVSGICGALTFRLFPVWSGDLGKADPDQSSSHILMVIPETLQVMFKTNFPTSSSFYPLEILLFTLLGLLCGAVSCCFLFLHRWILKLSKTNPIFIKMLTTEKALYSGLVVFFLASLTFPHSAGQYMASKLTMKQLLTSLLDSRQWIVQSHNASVQPLSEWSSSESPVYLSLAVFLLMKIWMLVLACTLPLPAGYFMPVFIYGAALGRLLGEGVAYVSFTGAISGQPWASINPGAYALAGAAALSGAVTHTLSPALLAVELTGHFSHVVPILLTTLLANALARSGHRPSFYDAISICKNLPHLPSLKKACPQLPFTPVGQVLDATSVQLQKAAKLEEVQQAVNTSSDTQIPVVDSHDSHILLGFALRSELLMLLRHWRMETPEKHLDEICCIYPTSVLLSPHNTVQEAHSTLSLIRPQSLFVADRGRLVGVITWTEMTRILEDLAKDISGDTQEISQSPDL
ncbi:chloride channel K [Xyrichtys novacula]|uniref:Chloride channel K n=1 Tax=Xyrichtys novacula TaxID=13765 RepID=A0AAV1F329_XYRNO|nr:chloride channel K [Xyrichtys novacula]